MPAKSARFSWDDLRARARATVARVWQVLWAQRLTFLAGLVGSLGAALVMILLRLTVGAPTLPELVGERILPLLNVDTFIKLLVTFQPHPKTGPLGLALLSQIALGVVLAPLLAWLGTRTIPRLTTLPFQPLPLAALFALVGTLVALVLFWPVMGQGLAGDPIALARTITGICVFVTLLSYGLITTWLLNRLARAPTSAAALTTTPPFTRRTLLGAVLVAGLAELAGIWAGLNSYLERSNLAYEGNETPADVRSAITPNEDFYVVSKNVLDPEVAIDRWRLEVAGMVTTPRIFTFAELTQLTDTSRAITMECISNGVGSRIMSTAEWRGVTLAQLLQAVGGPTSGATQVIFRSVDSFSSSLPLADLLDAKTLLAWEMNGVALPTRHGFPLRAVVPGRYGEQSPKWLTRIELSDQPYKGFYQSQGWSAHQVETTSRIDLPAGTIAPGPTLVQGIAFAGIRGIQRVEVSADDGLTWQAATMTPPLSDQTWVLWNWKWTPTAPGNYHLRVRATDGTGTVQTKMQRGTVPDGAAGWHRVTVVVR